MLTRYDVPTRMGRATGLTLALIGMLVLPVMAQQDVPEATSVTFTASDATTAKASEHTKAGSASVAFTGNVAAQSVEDRVGRLERMMGEVLAAVKQRPDAAQTTSEDSAGAANSYSSTEPQNGPRSQPHSAAIATYMAQLEGHDLEVALGDLQTQLEARRAELKRLANEVRRLEALVQFLRPSSMQAEEAVHQFLKSSDSESSNALLRP